MVMKKSTKGSFFTQRFRPLKFSVALRLSGFRNMGRVGGLLFADDSLSATSAGESGAVVRLGNRPDFKIFLAKTGQGSTR